MSLGKHRQNPKLYLDCFHTETHKTLIFSKVGGANHRIYLLPSESSDR